MSDASTLFWLAAASCVVGPALVCRAIPPANPRRKSLEDPGEDGPYGDRPSTPADFNLLHSPGDNL
jgi:hypothetical protein